MVSYQHFIPWVLLFASHSDPMPSAPLTAAPTAKSTTLDNKLNCLCLIPDRLFELITQVYDSRQITLAEHYGLLTILFDPKATEEELEWVDRLRWSVGHGYLHIVEELATELDFYTPDIWGEWA